MEIIIVKDGLSQKDEENLIDQQLGGKLSEEGIKTTKELAKHLSKVPLNQIYCSRAYKAKESLNLIFAEHFQDEPFSVYYSDDLLELNTKSIEGRFKQEVDYYKQKDTGKPFRLRRTAENEESTADVFFRISKFLDDLIVKNVHPNYKSGITEKNYKEINNILPENMDNDGDVFYKFNHGELSRDTKNVKITSTVLIITHTVPLAELINNLLYRMNRNMCHNLSFDNSSIFKIKIWKNPDNKRNIKDAKDQMRDLIRAGISDFARKKDEEAKIQKEKDKMRDLIKVGINRYMENEGKLKEIKKEQEAEYKKAHDDMRDQIKLGLAQFAKKQEDEQIQKLKTEHMNLIKEGIGNYMKEHENDIKAKQEFEEYKKDKEEMKNLIAIGLTDFMKNKQENELKKEIEEQKKKMSEMIKLGINSYMEVKDKEQKEMEEYKRTHDQMRDNIHRGITELFAKKKEEEEAKEKKRRGSMMKLIQEGIDEYMKEKQINDEIKKEKDKMRDLIKVGINQYMANEEKIKAEQKEVQKARDEIKNKIKTGLNEFMEDKKKKEDDAKREAELKKQEDEKDLIQKQKDANMKLIQEGMNNYMKEEAEKQKEKQEFKEYMKSKEPMMKLVMSGINEFMYQKKIDDEIKKELDDIKNDPTPEILLSFEAYNNTNHLSF